MDLLCGVRILAVDYFVLSQCSRLTDGRTDGRRDGCRQQDRARMHSQLHGTNCCHHTELCFPNTCVTG